MRHLDFDDLWKNHLFDYKDGDLLVIDDIRRLNLSDYEDTTLAFVMAVICMEGRAQCVVEGREYRLAAGDLFVYMPGQVISDILLSQNADVKVIAFAQRAIDRSLYLHKFVWQNQKYVRAHPLFTLSEREWLGIGHYYQLLMAKTQDPDGSFNHDVVRLLFQSLVLEFQMLVDRQRGEVSESEPLPMEKDSSVRQSTQIYRQFMALLAESKGRIRSVSVFANMQNVTPKYLSKCVKEESGRSPLDLIHETTIATIRQQLRYSSKTVKEICNDLDFPNLSFFGKFVREHLGLSPTEFRQQSLKDG